jgi:hypothetical protein
VRSLPLSTVLLYILFLGCQSDSSVTKLSSDGDPGDTPEDDPIEDSAAPPNTAPEISVVLRPIEAYTNDILMAEAEASDIDGDDLTVTYAFSAGGAVVQDGLSSTLDGALHFDKGQAVSVTASVSDSEYTASSESEAVLILNTAPEAPEVSLNRHLGCEDGWSLMDDGERCVSVFGESGPNWNEAQASCEAMGAELVSIHSEADNAQLVDLGTIQHVWIGYTDIAAEGTWVWTDGSEPAFENWLEGEPSNDGTGEHCALIYTVEPGPIGFWNDYLCDLGSDATGFACQRPATLGDLICTVDVPAADADLDTITYDFAWDVDGETHDAPITSTTHEGDTVPRPVLAGMADWGCTVTPHDGEVSGPSARATLTVGDADGDGVPDEEDCAPDMPDIPRLVMWESVATYAMDTNPPSTGAEWCDGAWGDQGVSDAYGRTAWRQESDWNSLWIPDPIADDVETYAVDVDLYLPSGDRGGEFGINRSMAGACNHSAGGLVLSYTDDRCSGEDPCLNIGGEGGPYYAGSRDDIFDRWVNMRLEVFQSDGLVQLWIDDELETCFIAAPEALVGPQVKFNANTSCCSIGPDLGISNLNFSTEG